MSQPTITDVMRTTSAEAVTYARDRFRMELDYSSQSLERVDRMLAAMYFDIPRTFFTKLFRRGPSHEEVLNFAKMWGAYVGEVIRRRWGGAWKSRLRPDGHAEISLDVLGQRYYPVEVMRQRFVEGHGKLRAAQPAAGAQGLYERVVKELGMARIDSMASGSTPIAPPLPRKMDPIPPSAPLLTRRQTVSDIVGLELEDVSGERSTHLLDDARPLDNLPLAPADDEADRK